MTIMDVLFDIPWYIPAAIAAIGIAVFVWANARLKRRERAAGLGIVALAILLTAVSYMVDTPRETVMRRTRDFVDAVVAKDSTAIAELLAADAAAYAWSKDEIVTGAIHYADETGLTGARLFHLDAAHEGTGLVSYLTVWSQHSGRASMPVTDLNSQWKLEWIEEQGAWRILEIIPLQIGQTPREAIERTYLDRPVPGRRR